jgi:hypothetical protein
VPRPATALPPRGRRRRPDRRAPRAAAPAENSAATVPWPAMTLRLSYGCTKRRAGGSADRRAPRSRAASVAAQWVISARRGAHRRGAWPPGCYPASRCRQECRAGAPRAPARGMVAGGCVATPRCLGLVRANTALAAPLPRTRRISEKSRT